MKILKYCYMERPYSNSFPLLNKLETSKCECARISFKVMQIMKSIRYSGSWEWLTKTALNQKN